MKMGLTNNMAGIVQEVVNLTPKEITNMSVEEIARHTKVMRKKNRMFYKIWKIRLPKRKKVKFSEILPRGSMIAAHHRFSYPEKTNRQIMKIR